MIFKISCTIFTKIYFNYIFYYAYCKILRCFLGIAYFVSLSLIKHPGFHVIYRIGIIHLKSDLLPQIVYECRKRSGSILPKLYRNWSVIIFRLAIIHFFVQSRKISPKFNLHNIVKERNSSFAINAQFPTDTSFSGRVTLCSLQA